MGKKISTFIINRNRIGGTIQNSEPNGLADLEPQISQFTSRATYFLEEERYVWAGPAQLICSQFIKINHYTSPGVEWV